MMKKILILIVSCFLIFSLTACGENTSEKVGKKHEVTPEIFEGKTNIGNKIHYYWLELTGLDSNYIYITKTTTNHYATDDIEVRIPMKLAEKGCLLYNRSNEKEYLLRILDSNEEEGIIMYTITEEER